mgnify:FL=1
MLFKSPSVRPPARATDRGCTTCRFPGPLGVAPRKLCVILRNPLPFSVRRNDSGLLISRGGRQADDRHGTSSRAGRDQRSAFWRVFRWRSTVHLWAARPDGGTLSQSIFPGAEGIRGFAWLFRVWFLGGRCQRFGGDPLQDNFLHLHFDHHRGKFVLLEIRWKAFNSLFPEFR